VITLYGVATANTRKVTILFEELGLRYQFHSMEGQRGENREPSYLEISPIGKMPAMVEDLPGDRRRRLFGSGAILLYFAEQTGQMMPTSASRRMEALGWLMMALTDLAPAAAYRNRFTHRAPEALPAAAPLLNDDIERCLNAMESRLSSVPYLAEEYSIADIACYPFIARMVGETAPEVLSAHPNLKPWYDAVSARPAVQRGMAIPA
jgi:GSH-dependent disulfide-bond oxidoreductase